MFFLIFVKMLISQLDLHEYNVQDSALNPYIEE